MSKEYVDPSRKDRAGLLTYDAMPVTPFSWNAVVVGAWNTAILVPDGIRRRLFELPDGTPVEIEVVIDARVPFRVKHDGLLVIPTSGRLEVGVQNSDLESLVRACAVCTRALRSLPETPVSAAGINVRYRFTELPDVIFDLVRAPLDGALSDAGFQVETAVAVRSVSVPPGVVRIKVEHVGGEGTIEFNFHRDSRTQPELVEWLGRAEEFVLLSDRLAEVLGVPDVRRTIHT